MSYRNDIHKNSVDVNGLSRHTSDTYPTQVNSCEGLNCRRKLTHKLGHFISNAWRRVTNNDDLVSLGEWSGYFCSNLCNKKQEILSCYGANQNVTKQTAITNAQ